MSNNYCLHECRYKGICRLDEDKTDLCKVWTDKPAQDFKRDRPIFGRSVSEIERMQGGKMR